GLRSALWIASSTLRTVFRTNERRALFTSVLRAITRVALRADFVLAITFSFATCASSGGPRKRLRFRRSYSGEKALPPRVRLIVRPHARVNVRKPASPHPFPSHRPVPADPRP